MTLKEKYNEKMKLHSNFVNEEFMSTLNNSIDYESELSNGTSILIKTDNVKDLGNDVCDMIKSITNFNIINPQYNILPLQNNNFIIMI